MPGYQGYLEVVLVLLVSIMKLQAWDVGRNMVQSPECGLSRMGRKRLPKRNGH